ncbi:MAG: hypothetical protein NDJ90_15885 [Oligoflexia bacterium]|nr:hypothetical protein [Oligoflexia bacterium]
MGCRLISHSALALLVLAVVACGTDREEAPSSTPGCAPGTASILVSDGYLRNLCGCNEAPGTSAAWPDTLTCTLPAGTHVFFRYASVSRSQQIGSVGTPAFATSPLSDPQKELPYRVHAVVFDTAGTYEFRDLLDSSVAGRIVVL